MDFKIVESNELGSETFKDRMRGFVNSFSEFSGIVFWRVGARCGIQNVRFRSFGFKGSEPGVSGDWLGFRVQG